MWAGNTETGGAAGGTDAFGPPAERRRHRWVGALSALLLALVVVLPMLRPARVARAPAPARSSDEAANSMSAVVSLTQAVGALAKLRDAHERPRHTERPRSEAEHARANRVSEPPLRQRLEREWQRPPPGPGLAPSRFASPTACMRTYLPPIELPERSLDFVCEETEFWSVEQRVYQEMAYRKGEGAKLWRRQGGYSLASIALMRRGCCADAEPPRAVVPGLWCGILRDRLRAFGDAATAGPIGEFEETLACLFERGVHLPERWGGELGDDARAAFLELARRSRDRHALAQTSR